MSGIFEQLLAAQLETNKLLSQLVAGGTGKAADTGTKTEAASKTAAADKKATGTKTGAANKPKGATVAQATAEVTKVRNEKGRDDAIRALTIDGKAYKLAEVTDEIADKVFKQAQAILAEVEEEELDEEEEEI